MNYFGFAALGTVVATTWNYIKRFIDRIRSYFIVSIKLEGYLSRAMQALLWSEFTRKHIGDRSYDGKMFNVRPLNKISLVCFEVIGKGLSIFWKGWKPIFVTAGSQNGGSTSNTSDNNSSAGFNNTITINFIRGTFDGDKLMIRAVDLFNARSVDVEDGSANFRFFIKKVTGTKRVQQRKDIYADYKSDSAVPTSGPPGQAEDLLIESGSRILKWKKEELGQDKPEHPFAALAFPGYVKDAIEELNRWKKSEKWFRSKFIPWRRGLLLHGVPGCGKSSLAKALAQSMDMPIFIYDLATMTNEDLNDKWKFMLTHTPVLALFEDLDSVFVGRKNIQGEDGVTFDCLLNCISGVESSDGVLTIVTTNDITKIDPAMGNFSDSEISSRPGRLDRIIELKQMDRVGRLSMAKRILEDCPEEIEKAVDRCDNFTPAQVQEYYTQIALNYYWKYNSIMNVKENKIEELEKISI